MMHINYKNVMKTTLFVIINPHLLLLLMVGGIISSIHHSLYFLSDKLDDAARAVKRLDRHLGSKDYWAWAKKLVE